MLLSDVPSLPQARAPAPKRTSPDHGSRAEKPRLALALGQRHTPIALPEVAALETPVLSAPLSVDRPRKTGNNT